MSAIKPIDPRIKSEFQVYRSLRLRTEEIDPEYFNDGRGNQVPMPRKIHATFCYLRNIYLGYDWFHGDAMDEQIEGTLRGCFSEVAVGYQPIFIKRTQLDTAVFATTHGNRFEVEMYFYDEYTDLTTYNDEPQRHSIYALLNEGDKRIEQLPRYINILLDAKVKNPLIETISPLTAQTVTEIRERRQSSL